MTLNYDIDTVNLRLEPRGGSICVYLRACGREALKFGRLSESTLHKYVLENEPHYSLSRHTQLGPDPIK